MEHFFDTREEASAAAAEYIGTQLTRRLELQDEASLVVSGGTSPMRCFELLSEADIDWPNVHILPSDERWVSAHSEDSNEKLIRDTLLRGKAAEARLHPMHSDLFSLEERCEMFEETVRTLPFPFACSMIGMGEDGHFASIFPDLPDLEGALDPDADESCREVRTAASPHPRTTLSFARLLASDLIVLLAFGEAKRAVLEAPDGLPVAALLAQTRTPVRVLWAA